MAIVSKTIAMIYPNLKAMYFLGDTWTMVYGLLFATPNITTFWSRISLRIDSISPFLSIPPLKSMVIVNTRKKILKIKFSKLSILFNEIMVDGNEKINNNKSEKNEFLEGEYILSIEDIRTNIELIFNAIK